MRPLGELEAVVMDHLWAADRPMSVRDVLDVLHRDPPHAYTTVMTVMDNLHRKGFLARERTGRAYLYTAVRGRAEHTAEVMHDMLASSGDTSSTLLKFLDQMTPAEVARLKRALE